MDKERFENAKPGDKIKIASGEYMGTWIRIEDAKLFCIKDIWVDIYTGRVCFHWSYLWEALENEQA